jgi:hypothetical protein
MVKTHFFQIQLVLLNWAFGYRIPRNLRFQLSDFESEWTLGKESFDLIHLRQGCGSVSSWPMLYKRIFEYVTYPTAPADAKWSTAGL